jgi:hypothetical protein
MVPQEVASLSEELIRTQEANEEEQRVRHSFSLKGLGLTSCKVIPTSVTEFDPANFLMTAAMKKIDNQPDFDSLESYGKKDYFLLPKVCLFISKVALRSSINYYVLHTNSE